MESVFGISAEETFCVSVVTTKLCCCGPKAATDDANDGEWWDLATVGQPIMEVVCKHGKISSFGKQSLVLLPAGLGLGIRTPKSPSLLPCCCVTRPHL